MSQEVQLGRLQNPCAPARFRPLGHEDDRVSARFAFFELYLYCSRERSVGGKLPPSISCSPAFQHVQGKRGRTVFERRAHVFGLLDAKLDVDGERFADVPVIEDVDRAYEVQAELQNQAIEQLRADRKAEKAARREERREELKAKFAEYEAATNRSMGIE